MKQILKHPIVAHHDEETITVYQAYNRQIGESAAKQGTLDVSGFSKTRMTWIKPSFLWMMYRAGWGEKDANQNCILRIKMTRSGFCNLLEKSCLSSFDRDQYDSRETWQSELAQKPSRVQWDPDKDYHLKPMERRAIQIGIASSLVETYIQDWILSIDDITQEAQAIRDLIKTGNLEEAQNRLLSETVISNEWLGN